MKIWLRFLFATLLTGLTAASALAQSQAVVTVGITRIVVNTGTGSVTSITVSAPGSGYSIAPTVTITGGGGSGATATATIVGGTVTGITVTSGGLGYTASPSVTLTGGGGSGATATGGVTFATTIFNTPNESFGPSGSRIDISALAVGTFPAGGFTYTYYVNGISIGTISNNPLNGNPGIASWTPPQPGSYFITVKADDGISGPALSQAVRYFATGTQIISPLNNTLVPVGSSIVLKGDATPPGGFIQRVDFYADGVFLGSDTTAPYSYIYSPPFTVGATIPLSTHTVDVRAYDNNGAQVSASLAAGTSANIIMVNPVGTSPTVSISTPSDGSALAIPNYTALPNASVPVTVSANDSDGILSKVELYVDGVLYATGVGFPYAFNWKPPVIGTFKLVALAYDDKNNVTASATNIIKISAPPSISLTSPIDGATVSLGTPQIITANAADSDGSVTAVQFYVEDKLITGAITFTAPNSYSISWIPAAKGDALKLTALATDNLGLTTLSSTVVVKVTDTSSGGGGGPVLGLPPVVAVTTPVAGTRLVVGAPVTIGANASDPDGNIFSVEFFVNNVSVGTDATYPYSVIWTPSSLGTFSITAKALDNAGNTVISAVVSVPVADPSAGVPTVSITSPASGSSFTVGSAQTIIATASDDGAIAGVQFYINGQPLGALVTTFPYKTNWTPSSPGNYSVTARATDDIGNQGTATAVAVTVTGGTAPTITLTNPAAGAKVALGSGVQIIANASDADGNVTQVQFFANGTLVGTVATAPFIASWTPTVAGAYNLTATATDNTGNTTTTAALAVTVTAVSAPVITISNPTTGASFNVGTAIPVNATVTGGNGAITQVQFFVNGVNIGTDLAAPYTATWTPVAAGTYTLFAVTSDSAGISTTSATVSVTIKANSPPTVSLVSPGTNLTVALGTSVNLSAIAGDADGSIASVRFIASGTVLDSVSSEPYSTIFTPTVAGVYSVVAQATDNSGNVTDSAPYIITVVGGNVPIVTLLNPGSDTAISADSSLLLSASASISSGNISRVEFYSGSTLLATKTAKPYTYVWRPSAIGSYAIRAVAYDSTGAGISSSVSTVRVGPRFAAPGDLYVKIASPTNGLNVVLFRNITYIADTNLPAGNSPQVDFYFNGFLKETVTAAPFQTTFSWVNPGQIEFYAVVRISGAVYTSAPVTLTVLPNNPPTVSLTAPTTGSSINVGSTVTIKATASDPDDLIDRVKFLVNGQILSTSTAFPYTASWTPSSEGIYTIEAIAKDSQGSIGGNETTSSAIYVRVTAPASSGGTAPDTIYGGTYFSASESGKFAAISLAGKSAVYIGFSTAGSVKTYFYSGLPVDAGGGFFKVDSSGRSLVNGVASESGVSGNVDGTRLTFIGPITFASGTAATAPGGYYAGNLSGKLDSTIAGIVGYDSSITVYIANGSFADAGSGRLNANGTFTLTTASGNLLTGKVEAATGLFTGTLAGSNGGGFTGALASGGSFSDGALRNLSTRGQVGTGANILIAGFVVGGTSPKQVLVRAIGPSLTQFGVTGVLADPQLSIFRSSTTIASNDNWGGSYPLVAASATAGGFALDPSSKDALVLTTLTPGAYTAQVSGVGGTTGVALVELYDLDATSPFSPQKVMNVATRGVVSSGQGALIAGFVINGTVSKKLLIRAVGPGLTGLGVAGALADPVLRVIRNDNVVVRENDNWETGNDASLVTEASSKSGAFALMPGSKDSALLFSLPPGTYTAQVSGANGTGGVALVEVYEVP